MKRILVVSIVIGLVLVGCAKPQTKFLGHWNNIGPHGEGLSYAYPPNWRFVEFRPDSKADVAWGHSEQLLDYKIVDNQWLEIGGYSFRYELNGDELTVVQTQVGNTKFKKQ